MENFEQELNAKETEPLKDFQEEIKNLQIQEQQKSEKEIEECSDFTDIIPEQLTENDMKMWHWYQNLKANPDSITQEDIDKFDEYRETIDKKQTPGRNSFTMYLANKITSIWGNKQLDDMDLREKE